MSRYARQIVLDEIGEAGQERLANARVLCIGAGGLGAPALLYLAAAGVGTLGIADFDIVDESNLQRQILYSTDQTGQSKAEMAKERLCALNPYITINIHADGLTLENAENLFADYDIIIDGTDNFAAKFLINDASVKFGTPFVYGAIQRFDGQASVFGMPNGPCYRCLYPAPPAQPVLNCAEGGVIGAVAGITGTTQAMQVIMLIVGDESFAPLTGKLWSIDTKTMQSRILDIPKDPACPVCSQAPDDIVLTYKAPICTTSTQDKTMNEISIDELSTLDNPLYVDVREGHEWDEGHIPDAQHISLSSLLHGTNVTLPDDRPVVLYCQKGRRSLQALEILQQTGLNNLVSLRGGYEVWALHT